MAPSKYLIRALSTPTKVEEAKWEKWYATEHIPHTVDAGVGDRGAVYRAYDDFTLQAKTPPGGGEGNVRGTTFKHFDEGKSFLASYQTSLEDYAESEKAKDIPQTSEMFGGEAFLPLAEWDVRIYELIQDYNPGGLRDTVPPFKLEVQADPTDEAAYHDFYENEHLDLLHKVPGYRRSQRYRLIRNVFGAPADVPKFLVIHEWEHMDALDGPEQRRADESPTVAKVFGNVNAMNVRGFKLVEGSGRGYEK